MVHYATIVIRIHAEEEDINGPDEIEMSDEVSYLMEDLDEWLAEREEDRFRFTVDSHA